MIRIAVIDNDPEFVSLLEVLLAERGWQLCSWAHGEVSLAAITASQPAALLLDLRLEPPSSGWELLRLLKDDPATSSLPIILCSGALDELWGKEEWLRAQGIAVLPKPFDIDVLYACVEQALRSAVRPLPARGTQSSVVR